MTARSSVGWTLAAAASTALALGSRWAVEPVPATSYAVVVASLAASVLVLLARSGLDSGWLAWRRALLALAALVSAYPGLWGLAVLVSDVAPGSPAAWATATVALVAHLPVLAAFSLLPLAAVRYLGRGSGRGPALVVAGLGIAAVVTFALFFDDHASPIAASAPIASGPGETVGAAINALFLATVLLGPAVATYAAARADGVVARRLAQVSTSALAGAGLVMLCGALGAVTGLGAVVVLLGLDAALVAVAVGSTRALQVPRPTVGPEVPVAVPDLAPDVGPEVLPAPGPSDPVSVLGVLTPREAEVLGLLAEGLSNAGIAARLVLSERTVDAHLRSVFAKLALPEGPQDNRRVHAVNAWRDGVPATRTESRRAV